MDLLTAAKTRVIEQFPEVVDVEPSVVEISPRVTIFTFHKLLKAEDGTQFPETVRISIDHNTGTVLKVAVSKSVPFPET